MLVVNDQGSAAQDLYTLAGNVINRANMAGIAFGSLLSITLNAGNGSLDVQGTPAGTSVTINGSSGGTSDQFNVSDALNRLNEILGSLTLVGQNPDSNVFNFTDSGTTKGHTYTLTGTTYQRDDLPPITYRDAGNAVGASLDFVAGSGGNTFNVESTDGSSYTQVDSGTGQNQVNVLATVSTSQLVLEGQGSNLVRVGSQSLSMADMAAHGGSLANILGTVFVEAGPTLVLDNSGDLASHTGVVLKYDELDTLAPAPIQWTPGTITGVVLHSGNGNNAFDIQGLSQYAPLTIDAGTGVNAVTLDNVDLGSGDTANADHHLTLAGLGNANTFTFDDSRSPATHTYTTQGFSVTRTNFPVTVDLDSSFQGVVASQANLIANGSFESPVVPVGSYLDYAGGSSAIPGWTVAGSDVAVISGAFTQSGITFNAADGKQWLDLTGVTSNSMTNGVTQTVATTIGQEYQLTFDVGSTSDGSLFFPATVDLSIDGGARTHYFNSNITPKAQNWEQFTVDFTATHSTTNLAFFDGSAANNFSAGLDNVQLTALGPGGVSIRGGSNGERHLQNP